MEELKRALAEQLGLRKHIFETEVQPLIDSTRSRAMTGEEQQKSADIDARIRAIDSRILQLRGQIDTEEQRAELGLGGSGWGGGGSADGEFGEQMRDMLRGRRTEPVELTVPMQRGAVTVAGGMRVRALTTAGSGANTIGVSVFNQLVQSMQDGSGLLRAGVTMVATDTGEPLIVPRGAVGAADLVAEGQPISGTDPTLSSTTLRAYKLGQIVKVNREFLEDTDPMVGTYVAAQAGLALGLGMGNLLVTGTGTNEPTGLLTAATVGVTGPTGTTTGFGAQATAGQGTDLLNDLFASVAEPYAGSPAAAFLARNATITKVKNLKTTAGDPVGTGFVANGAGAPFIPDAFMPVPAAGATTVAFGDWRAFWVRIVGGVRFERSDHVLFDSDQVAFKATVRFDGALVDPGAVRLYKHSAT